MMDYGGGDLLLAGAAGCWVTVRGLSAGLSGDLNPQPGGLVTEVC